jgi:hypothetical protein
MANKISTDFVTTRQARFSLIFTSSLLYLIRLYTATNAIRNSAHYVLGYILTNLVTYYQTRGKHLSVYNNSIINMHRIAHCNILFRQTVEPAIPMCAQKMTLLSN